MDFPILDLMDQDACYHKLVGLLHPGGLACPSCKTDDHIRVHRRHRAPVLDYRCVACRRVFNAFTGPPAQIMLILRGFAQGVPTAQLARELGCDRKHLLELRRLMQDNASRWLDRNPLGDPVVEGDEMYQNAGEEGIEHPDPDDPPRYRANNRRGHGNFANDRPPVAGVVGRESGEVRLEVLDSSGSEELGEFVDRSCLSGATVNTDEWVGYSRVAGRHERIQVTADHSGPRSSYAVDADGDGVREVHCDTMEGIWTGARNFLRPFRGVSKWCESQYVAMFEWGHNIKEVADEFLRVMLGLRPHTEFAS
jgi:hypothetical protein